MSGVRPVTRCLLVLSLFLVNSHSYKIGIGIADMTGPAAEVAFVSIRSYRSITSSGHLAEIEMCSQSTTCFPSHFQMGYAQPNQRGSGIHLRQFARCFIVNDSTERFLFVSAEIGMMSTMLRQQVSLSRICLVSK